MEAKEPPRASGCASMSRTCRCGRTTAGRSLLRRPRQGAQGDHQLHLHQLHRHVSADVREPGARAGDARRSDRPRHLHRLAAASIRALHAGPARPVRRATFDARPGWTFATGRIEDINTIRRRLGLYDSEDITQHMGLLTFGNERRESGRDAGARRTEEHPLLRAAAGRPVPVHRVAHRHASCCTGSGTER